MFLPQNFLFTSMSCLLNAFLIITILVGSLFTSSHLKTHDLILEMQA